MDERLNDWILGKMGPTTEESFDFEKYLLLTNKEP